MLAGSGWFRLPGGGWFRLPGSGLLMLHLSAMKRAGRQKQKDPCQGPSLCLVLICVFCGVTSVPRRFGAALHHIDAALHEHYLYSHATTHWIA